MFRLLLIFCILSIVEINGWPERKSLLKLKTEEKCCVKPKWNINSSLANQGREFFAELILNNESSKNINEKTMCSLMHFFIQQAVLNGRSVDFVRGIFVLYDSSKEFFNRFMIAKDAQTNGFGENRSGYWKRIKYFAWKKFQSLFQSEEEKNNEKSKPFIYLRGDESSHFRERGSSKYRKFIYPAYGMDISNECLPNGFGHILFGKLKSLFDNQTDPYYGDRIYIKPERYGLQKFKDYIKHSKSYLKYQSRRVLCKLEETFCSTNEAFRENIDQELTNQWNQILARIENLSEQEKENLTKNASTYGIHEISRQISLFPNGSKEIHEFYKRLETKYGSDVRSRKGNEIIFTTEQLLDSQTTCHSMWTLENLLCPVKNKI